MKKFFDETKVEWLIRFWTAGAVYFFVGWGTNLGGQTSLIDYIFFLGIAIGIFELYITKTIIRHILKSPKEYIRYKQHREKELLQRVVSNLLFLLKSIFIILVVSSIYSSINQLAIYLFELSNDQIFLPGEPILFGVFYTLVYTWIERIIERINCRIKGVQ
ncbi:hypothetical protein QBE53_15490 [Vallitaleaceae bacterium 9-2]